MFQNFVKFHLSTESKSALEGNLNAPRAWYSEFILLHTPSSYIWFSSLVLCFNFEYIIYPGTRSQIKMKSGKKMIEITLRSFAIWLSLGEIELVSFQRPLFVPSGTKKIDMEFLHVKGNSWFCCLAFIIVWGWCEISRVFVAGLEFGNHPVSNWNTSTLMVDL